MASRGRPKRAKVRGKQTKAEFPLGLAEIAVLLCKGEHVSNRARQHPVPGDSR